jgi:sn-glycerol 3-phosphate transport system substrate-binding protein
MKKSTATIAFVFSLASAGLITGLAQEGKTKINFWHSMGGVNGEATNKMVANFNASSSTCEVVATNVGSYDDGLTKLQAALRAKTPPNIQQIYDLGLLAMADSGVIIPASELASKYKINLSSIISPLSGYYNLQGKYYGVPFNASTPEVYYNKQMFKEAGLSKPPKTFEEFLSASRKLTKKDSDGKVMQYGSSIRVYGWFIEQLIYNQGGYVVNGENGRAKRATAVEFNGAAGQRAVKWIVDMTREGINANVGRDGAAQRQVFTSGKAAMFMESTATLGAVTREVGGKFEFGTVALPRPTGTKGGTAIGGAALYAFKGNPEPQNQCSADFIKYAISPMVQLEWHKATGYYPVSRDALSLPETKQYWKTNPNAKTPIDIILSSPPTHSSQGAVAGVMPQIRANVEEAMELAIAGKSSVEEALNAAAAKSNEAITRYNTSVGK